MRNNIKDFKAHSLAFDESTDISDTSQLEFFIIGVNESFQVTQELLNLVSLKDTTKCKDVFSSHNKMFV